MRVYIQPYSSDSESAKTFAAALRNDGIEARRLRVTNSNYSGKPEDIVINWGSSTPRAYLSQVKEVLNHPQNVRLAVNKMLTLRKLTQANINIPRYTTDYLQALEWIYQDGLVMAARTHLAAHSGKGIVISRDGDHLPKAPLYTQFTKSKGEYRIHIFKGEMIDYAKKRRKTGEPPVGIEKSIRSHNNGWIYARHNADGEPIPIPDHFVEHAAAAVEALGLDFGAADVLNVDGEPVILEINSAPGLVGNTTINSYVGAVRSYLEKL